MITFEKWIIIAMMLLFGILMTGLGVAEYSKIQCRIEAIKAGVEADKIALACGSTK